MARYRTDLACARASVNGAVCPVPWARRPAARGTAAARALMKRTTFTARASTPGINIEDLFEIVLGRASVL
jgi:hypothetical protein